MRYSEIKRNRVVSKTKHSPAMLEEFLHGMPAGQTVSRFGSGISFFFFVVATNLHINLFIKLSPLLVRMCCSDCLQQKRPNENLLSALLSRGRGPPHPYLCDIKSSFDYSLNLDQILLSSCSHHIV